MIVTTGQLFKHAYGKYAVGAYNINNAEQAMGLFKGCISSQAPFIIQISKGARKYTDKRMLEAIIRSAGEIFPEAIFAVHLDHGDEQTCYECIDSGFFSSVMIDASHESFAENVAITKRVVDKAHAKGISVEAELGMLGGVEEDIKVEEGHAMLTNPAEAKDFGLSGMMAGVGVIAAISASILLAFWMTGLISRVLGKIGMTIVVRILGLILCAMAVQFIIAGVAGSTHNLVRRDAVTPYAADK